MLTEPIIASKTQTKMVTFKFCFCGFILVFNSCCRFLCLKFCLLNYQKNLQKGRVYLNGRGRTMTFDRPTAFVLDPLFFGHQTPSNTMQNIYFGLFIWRQIFVKREFTFSFFYGNNEIPPLSNWIVRGRCKVSNHKNPVFSDEKSTKFYTSRSFVSFDKSS